MLCDNQQKQIHVTVFERHASRPLKKDIISIFRNPEELHVIFTSCSREQL